MIEDEPAIGTPHITYSVELSTKEHGREDVKAAKQKEIENLNNYKVYEKVQDVGQKLVGATWVITEKEGHDGQKRRAKQGWLLEAFKKKTKNNLIHQQRKENPCDCSELQQQ